MFKIKREMNLCIVQPEFKKGQLEIKKGEEVININIDINIISGAIYFYYCKQSVNTELGYNYSHAVYRYINREYINNHFNDMLFNNLKLDYKKMIMA